MLNIAIISDIHGNLPALKAVLENIRKQNAAQIYCLGDLTDAAPWHNEVIDLIKEMRIPAIMGNHDQRIAFDHPVLPLEKHSAEEQAAREIAINFTKRTITPANKNFLGSLPHTIQLNFNNVKILMVHGSTRNNDEYIYEDHHEEDLIAEMKEADLLVMGHTHLSYIRHLRNGKMVANAGSVGRTKEMDGLATYLVLTINGNERPFDAAIRKVSYLVNETIEGIKDSDIPDFYAARLAEKYLPPVV